MFALAVQLPTSARACRAIIRFSSVFYHIRGNAAVRRADALPVFPVGRLVELKPQPAALAADRASHRYRILADTGGEHNSIEATKRGRKRSDMGGNAIAEHFDRKACTRLVAG